MLTLLCLIGNHITAVKLQINVCLAVITKKAILYVVVVLFW